MSKHIAHEILGIFLKVKCPVKDKEGEVKIDGERIYTRSQECDICGSHGDTTVDYDCPVCGQTHEFEIKSW